MIAAELSEQFWWYVARSSGFVSWGTVTLAVVWGLALSTRLMGKKATPAWLLDAHRFLGALSLIFIAVHLVALVLDSYVHFGLAELFVPMASEWQPGAVAWGVVGFYLLVAIQLTSWTMDRIPRRLWRWVHFSSFALYVFSTVHAIEAGTDVTNPVFRYAALASVQLVLFLVGVRVLTARQLKRARRDRGEGASVDDQRAARLAALAERRAAAASAAPALSDGPAGSENSGAPFGGTTTATAGGPVETAMPSAISPEVAERLARLRERRNGVGARQ